MEKIFVAVFFLILLCACSLIALYVYGGVEIVRHILGG